MNACDVLIIGSGFAGVAAAISLREAGFHDVVILERADSIGGTWRDNHYPGCACDVPSRLYSLSFAPNDRWTRSYSPQPEIRAYLERVVQESGITPLIRFNHNVQSAHWDADVSRWQVATTQGTFCARVLILATGALSDPVLPGVPGRETFHGPSFHSSQWDHTVPMDRARVLVIGTGASVIQFVPEIQPQVARLTLFQRTPPWILPRFDRTYRAWERATYRRVPLLGQMARSAIYASREATFLAFRDVRFARQAQCGSRAAVAAGISTPPAATRRSGPISRSASDSVFGDSMPPTTTSSQGVHVDHTCSAARRTPAGGRRSARRTHAGWSCPKVVDGASAHDRRADA